MACQRRERTGVCRHSTCRSPVESGYECVEIVVDEERSFCEAGGGCPVASCPWRWDENDEETTEHVLALFEELYPDLPGEGR